MLGTGLNNLIHQPCPELISPTAVAGAVTRDFVAYNVPIAQAPAPDFLIETHGDIERVCEGNTSMMVTPTDVADDVRVDPNSSSVNVESAMMYISPNPVRSGSDVKVMLQRPLSAAVIINVHDVRGSLTISYSGAEFGDVSELSISTEDLAAGAYSVSIGDGDTLHRQSLLIID